MTMRMLPLLFCVWAGTSDRSALLILLDLLIAAMSPVALWEEIGVTVELQPEM